MNMDLISELVETTPSKIVLLVADGLGGLRDPSTGKSELEAAHTPNLDALAAKSTLGLTYPVAPGITPGSGPGHLGLFGYDPERFLIKRGVMEALGIGLDLGPGEVATRGNFCTLDAQGNIADRRAGRIPSLESAPLVNLLNDIEVQGVEIAVYPVKDHRFVAIFKGEGLADDVSESDPQKLGVPPRPFEALSTGSERMAKIAGDFAAQARQALSGRDRANGVLLRGFSHYPDIPSMAELYRLTPAAIATYPMYRGLAKIVGMTLLETGSTLDDELATLAAHWDRHDYFFVHFKPTDAAGEDGDFDKKARALEEFDTAIPRVLDLGPDVLMVGGDHATPSALAAHSWHPVPFLLHSQYSGVDGIAEFSERSCGQGSLGRFPAMEGMVLAMANALKLAKFGA